MENSKKQYSIEELKILPISKAKKINSLIVKKKKLFKEIVAIREIEPPLMQFKRKSGKVEFFESATKGKFEFKDADGKDRFIVLDGSNQLDFPTFNGEYIKGYWCDEENPFPLPQKPLLSQQEFGMAQEEALHAVSKYRGKELEGLGNMFLKIGLGIAAIGGMYVLYKLVIPDHSNTAQEVQAIGQATQQIIDQSSVTVLDK